MAISAFQKVVNKLFQQFVRQWGREPQTPKEWMDLQNEAVQFFNKTKGVSPGPKKPPFQGWNPKVIQGGKGIESLIKSGDVKKGVAPKTTAKTLADKKDRSLLFSDATEEIEKIKLRNKQAVKDFKEKNTPKVYSKGDEGYDEITEKLGITARPGHPLTLEGKADLKVVKTKKKDRPSIRLIKNFEKELTDIDLAKEGYNLQEIGILKRARQVMKDEGQNPDDALAWVRGEMADDAGIDFEDFMTDFDWGDFPGKAEGGIARAGYFFGGKALKAIRDAWRANKTWGVGGPPYKPEATSFNVKEMTKRNLGTELSLSDLRDLSKSPLMERGGQTFNQFNQEFKIIKARILKQKLEESKLQAEAMIKSADMVPADNATAKKVQAQFTREGKKQLEEAKEGLKEIDIYMGMLQKQGRSVHQSGGLAYMLGEPNTRIEALQHAGVIADPKGLYTDPSIYSKGESEIPQNYYEGGGVGHGPWTKGPDPRIPEQPPQPETPVHHAQGQPDPTKIPQGIPSVAPRTMDPRYIQQQRMQQMMAMGQQGMMGQGPRPMANEGGIIRSAFKNGGKMSRRGFLKLMTGLAALPVIGKYFKAAKVAKPAAAVTETIVKSNAAGMPAWFPSLVKRVLKEGKDETATLGIIERQTVHTAKTPEGTPIQVTRDLVTNDIIVDIGEQTKHGWGAGRHGQPVQLQLKKGEWIEPTQGKKGIKTKDEFIVDEAEFTGGHPENIKFEESVQFKYGDHGSDFSEVERYAIGKNKDKKIIGKQAARDDWAEGRAMEQAEDVDYASGGLAYLLGE
jgi:hypothetical protein